MWDQFLSGQPVLNLLDGGVEVYVAESRYRSSLAFESSADDSPDTEGASTRSLFRRPSPTIRAS